MKKRMTIQDKNHWSNGIKRLDLPDFSVSLLLFCINTAVLLIFLSGQGISDTVESSLRHIGTAVLIQKTNKSQEKEIITMNEFNEYVYECFSAVGDVVIRSMMGGYLVYFNGKLIGDIAGNVLLLKRTPTSDRLLAESELSYPYEGSKTLMYVFERFEDRDLIEELLAGMYA